VLSFPIAKEPATAVPKRQVTTRIVSAEMIRDIIDGKIALPYNQLFILPNIGLLNSADLNISLLRSLITGSK
jgi:hypothetical protein